MESKKQKIVSAVATFGIILTLFGATYAYFASRVDAGKITDVEITANTVDVFSFETGDPVSLNINQENFASGTGNQTASTFAGAILSANNKTNTATEHYYLYLSISNNTFTYSKDSTYPEILVKITDSDGNELVDSDVEGLTHKTVVDAQGNTVTGFDVTDKEGTITILNNREITTTSTKSESWTFTFTFVNYDFNQAANAGGHFSARVLIKKNGAIMSDVCKDGDNLSDCIIAMYGIDDTLYYHDENLENGANDNSYRYAGGNNHSDDYYACSYNNVLVYNYENRRYNHSLLGDCDTVYEVDYQDKYIDASFETYYYNEPVSIAWDSENNVCLTVNGYEVRVWGYETINVPDFCTGVAYQYKDTTNYYAGIEKVGAGTETLYDADNNFYSCEYNDISVSDYNNGYNRSRQGNCSTVYKISYQKKYYDKSYQDYIIEKVNVEWDTTNKICKTVNGDDVYDRQNYIIRDPSLCIETADYVDGYTYNDGWHGESRYYLGISKVGSGNATLYDKAVEINNFVCFGSEEYTCPNDNLYRIIGVFDGRVRLIKADYATGAMLGMDTSDYGGYRHDTSYYQGDSSNLINIAGYYWNENTNDWSYSELNKTHLNKNYINYLSDIDVKWTNMIDSTEWKVGGFANSNVMPSILYTNEIISPSTQVASIYVSKVGLMYVSDYAFAAASSAWTTTPAYYDGEDVGGNKITGENWMYMGLYEWTMERCSSGNDYAYYVSIMGDIGTNHVHYVPGSETWAVRPVFHLKSNIKYISGSGTKSDSIRLG